MADITSSVRIRGSSQHNERPIGWHVWDVLIPSGTLTAGQVDDILLPDRFPYGTIVLDAYTGTLETITIATSCVFDLERVRVARADGAVDEVANLVAGNDVETFDRTGFSEAGSVVPLDWFDTEANGGLDSGSSNPSYDGGFQIEITPTGAITAGDVRIMAAVLLGRVVY